MASRSTIVRHIFWCFSGMLLFAAPFHATGEELSSREMLVRMLEALAVPEGYEGSMTAQSQTSWAGSTRIGPEYEGAFSDAWEYLRLDGRVGKESHRELPGGPRCTRVVTNDADIRSLELTTDHARAARIDIWPIRTESPSWGVPVLDYLDRGLPSPRALQGSRELDFPAAELVSLDGVPCYHIRFAWDRRHVEIWLDPEFNYLPRQYFLKLDYWHHVDLRNVRAASRDPERPIRERMKVPEFMEEAMGRPLTSEERMFDVVLERAEGVPYIKRASIEKTMQLGDGITHLETITLESEAPRSLDDTTRARAFLDFDGLIPDETPVVLRGEAGQEPVALVWRDGDLAPPHGSIVAMATGTWRGLRSFFADFSVDRVRELDTWVLAVACALVAVLVNVVLVFSARRRRRLEPPPDVKGTK